MNFRMCFALLVGFACVSIAPAQLAVPSDTPQVPATGPATGKPPEVARLLHQLAQARTLVENALDFSQSMQVENLRLRGEVAKLKKTLADRHNLTARLRRAKDQLQIEISRLKIQVASLRSGDPSAVMPPTPQATTRPVRSPSTRPVPTPATQPTQPAGTDVFGGRVKRIGQTSAIISFPIDRLVAKDEKFHIFRGTKLMAVFIAQQVMPGSAMGKVSDVKETVKVGDRVVRTSKAPAPAVQVVSGGKGRVKGILKDMASITIGKNDGVTNGMQFYIHRGEKLIAVFTAARVVANETVGRLSDVTAPVRIGDHVVPKTGHR